MITETKGDSPKIVIDRDRYQVSSVKEWWLQEKEDSSINHDPLIKNYPNIEIVVDNKPTAPTEKQIFSQKNIMEKPQSSSQKSLINELDEIDLDISSKSESYIEHLKDIARDQPEIFIDEEKPDELGRQNLENMERKNKDKKPWCDQNLLLLIEIIGVSIAIRKYKSGRLVTEVSNFSSIKHSIFLETN